MIDWVPVRWFSSDPRSLDLIAPPVNCLLLEPALRAKPLLEAARARGLHVPENIDLPPRRGVRFDSPSPVIGTSQGVWPGVEVEHGGSKTAAPTGGVWVNTNIGFLRYARAAAPSKMFWMGIVPPAGEQHTVSRYLQAVSESGALGARWVIAIDAAFQKRLLARDAAALGDWKRVLAQAQFYESHAEWRSWKPHSQLALVQDEASAVVSGNLLDMLSVMNTPVRAVPSRELDAVSLNDTRIAVSLDPRAYTDEQRRLMDRFRGRVIAGPKDWAMPVPPGDRITFDRAEYKQLEVIWPELQLAIARQNFGVRLFNVSGVLSHLLESPTGGRLLHLINYTDYPVENVTAFVQGRYRKATLLRPGAAPRRLPVFEAPDGTQVELERFEISAAILMDL